ncbi:hypothetical protein ACLB2K_003896 [Fragaria x ananassa]
MALYASLEYQVSHMLHRIGCPLYTDEFAVGPSDPPPRLLEPIPFNYPYPNMYPSPNPTNLTEQTQIQNPNTTQIPYGYAYSTPHIVGKIPNFINSETLSLPNIPSPDIHEPLDFQIPPPVDFTITFISSTLETLNLKRGSFEADEPPYTKRPCLISQHNQGSILHLGLGFSVEENNEASFSRGSNGVYSKRSNRRRGKGKAKAWLKQVMSHEQTHYGQANAARFHANILDGETLYKVQIHSAEQVQIRRHGDTTIPTPPNVQFSDLFEQDKDEGCGGWPGAATD